MRFAQSEKAIRTRPPPFSPEGLKSAQVLAGRASLGGGTPLQLSAWCSLLRQTIQYQNYASVLQVTPPPHSLPPFKPTAVRRF